MEGETTLVTTLGPFAALPNVGSFSDMHVFCDLRTYESPDHARADEGEVSAVMAPSCDKRGSWG